MTLCTILARFRIFLICIPFISPVLLQAEDFQSKSPSFLKSSAMAWRNGIRYVAQTIAQHKEKALAVSLLAYARLANATGNEFMINDATTSALSGPQLAARPDGNVFAVWNDGNSAYMRVVSENGTLVSNQVPLSSSDGTTQSLPSIASFNDSSAMATWINGNNIVYRLFNANGTANGMDVQLASDSNSNYPLNRVLGLKNGNALVAYNAYQAPIDYVVQEFDRNAIAQTGIVSVDTNNNPPLLQPCFAIAEGGPNNTISFVDGYDQTLGLFPLNSSTLVPQTNWQYNTGATFIDGTLSNGVFANNNLLTVWIGILSGSTQIHGAVFGPTGNVIKGAFPLATPQYLQPLGSSVAMFNNSNNALVVFASQRQGSNSSYDIYGTVLDSDGNIVVSPYTINQVTAGDQTNAVSSTLPNGDVFVAWQGSQTGNNHQIYGIALSAAQSMMPSPYSPPSSTGVASSSSTGGRSSSSTGVASSSSTGGRYSSSMGVRDSSSGQPNLFSGSSSSSSSSTGEPDPVIGGGQSSSSVLSDLLTKVGAAVGSVATAALGFSARQLWSRYKAKAFRAAGARFQFCDLLRKKLNLTPWDFRIDEGKEFCDAINHLLKLLSDHARSKAGAEFDINRCSSEHLEGLATIFAKTIVARNLVVNIGRQCKNYCMKQRLIANAEISDELFDDYDGPAFIIEVVEALAKDKALYEAIMYKEQMEMALFNPAHRDSKIINVSQMPASPTQKNIRWIYNEGDEKDEYKLPGVDNRNETTPPPPPIEDDIEVIIA